MGGGGVQRVTKFVKYLEECGWRCTIIAGRAEDYWMRDETLVADLPASAHVERTAAASGIGVLRRLRPQTSTRAGAGAGATSRRSSGLYAFLRGAGSFFLVPDTYIGWQPFALRAAREVIARDPPQALLSSAPPETNHIVGLQLARETGLPWVADFRDPWFGLHLRKPPTAWHARRHAQLEAAVLGRASAVVATTLWLHDLLAARAPRPLPHLRVIRNGFDAADFAAPAPPHGAASGGSAAQATPRTTTGPLHLAHTGMLTLTRSAEGLLAAIARLHAHDPSLRGAFQVELIGARESRNDAAAAAAELAGCVHVRDYVPHRAAIAAMQAADVLVLIKHLEPRYSGLVPGKLYEYMGAGRPILGLVPDSEAADLIRDLGWGEVVPPDDPEAIAAALQRLLALKRQGRLQGAYPMRGRDQFERRRQAAALAALLDEVTASAAPVPRRVR
jgi:glycosyltransferase involved in cell wall biosynthesis